MFRLCIYDNICTSYMELDKYELIKCEGGSAGKENPDEDNSECKKTNSFKKKIININWS